MQRNTMPCFAVSFQGRRHQDSSPVRTRRPETPGLILRDNTIQEIWCRIHTHNVSTKSIEDPKRACF
ncbi:hypothetical protein TNCV_2323741 [Trichonephila clavipes]|nr:hypothetical protein TNCV_2323741 [Trichonephila clavipes]